MGNAHGAAASSIPSSTLHGRTAALVIDQTFGLFFSLLDTAHFVAWCVDDEESDEEMRSPSAASGASSVAARAMMARGVEQSTRAG
eukprot:scaffold81345_cov32-Tisochrysis_lutea.AAC.1